MAPRASPTYNPNHHLRHRSPHTRRSSPKHVESRSSYIDQQSPFFLSRTAGEEHHLRTDANPRAVIRVVGSLNGLVRITSLGLHLL